MNDTYLKYLEEDGEAATSGAETTDLVAKYAKPVGFKVQKRKKKKVKVVEPLDEAAKAISTKDIINALGGDAFLKKTFTTVGAAYKYIISNLNKVLTTFGMSVKDVPLKSIETHLREIIKEKR